MRKVTCIVGSPRTNGSSNYLVDALISEINEEKIEVKKYSISQCDINYCCGCKKCYDNGSCIYDDDVIKIITDILTSDYVIIVSPSYWADVPGKLKTLFDRTTPFGDTNPNRTIKSNKSAKGIAIAVRAGSHHEENELILNSIEHYFGHLGIKTVKRISVCSTNTLSDLLKTQTEVIDEVKNMGKSISEELSL